MALELEGTSPWVATAHWVTYGETLSSIAAIYGHDPAVLSAYNQLDDPTALLPGERILTVPATSSATDDCA